MLDGHKYQICHDVQYSVLATSLRHIHFFFTYFWPIWTANAQIRNKAAPFSSIIYKVGSNCLRIAMVILITKYYIFYMQMICAHQYTKIGVKKWTRKLRANSTAGGKKRSWMIGCQSAVHGLRQKCENYVQTVTSGWKKQLFDCKTVQSEAKRSGNYAQTAKWLKKVTIWLSKCWDRNKTSISKCYNFLYVIKVMDYQKLKPCCVQNLIQKQSPCL